MPDPGPRGSSGRTPVQRRERRGNLPAELSSFVGRRREATDVGNLVRRSRSVTLTGVGGAGKTRLALHVAEDLWRTFDHGVWFVDLAEARRPGTVVPLPRDPATPPGRPVDGVPPDGVAADDVVAYLVMSALDMRPHGAGPPAAELAGYLAGRRALLVLDNCEPVLSECARLVDELLRRCPELRVLATSREPLALAGETSYPVPPLPVPDLDPDRADAADLERYDSVALFVERARAAVPSFELTDANRESVRQLCTRLDGLPLAIELAAARVRVLAPHQILSRLNDRFALLSRGSRDAPPRQQTLRACVGWSFDLCSEPEQLLWARLSVFAGGFEPDAVAEVCADDALPRDGLEGLLAGLADKSIVDRVARGGSGGGRAPVRYRMLETLRGFGRERLAEAGGEATVRRRHRDWCGRLVDRARAEWFSDRQVAWFRRLSDERANLRAAVELRLGEPGEAEAVLHLLVTLPPVLWSNHGLAREGLTWLDRALAEATAPTAVRARALALAAGLSTRAGDATGHARRLSEARHLAGRLDDPVALATCAYIDAAAAWGGNDLPGAVEAAERGLTELSRLPEPDLLLRLHLLLHAQWAAAMAGDEERSRRYSAALLAASESRGELANRSMAEWGIAVAAWRAGDLAEAARHVRASVRLRQAADMPYVHHAGLNVELTAWIAGRQEHHRRAATLLGAADRLLGEHGTPIATTYRMLLDDHRGCERRAREVLGHDVFADAFRRGHAYTLEEALAAAVDARPAPAPGPAAPGDPVPLTRRELEVAELVGQGLSNKEIARALVVSRRTAEAHVQRILTKLGFANRAQLAAWIVSR